MNNFLKSIIFIIFITVISITAVPTAMAGFLSIKLEEPRTPTNDNSFKINFVALDTQNQSITVKCFKKGPSDSDFVQFGSDIVLPAGGSSGDCIVDSSSMANQGSYQFYVSAQAGADSATSQTVSVDYKTETPGTPSDYSKERFGVNSCDYTIRFKTSADNGKTKKVEIYMSSLTSFSADAGTRVGTVTIGSNQEGHFTTTAPDCSKTFYFAIRAFDDAGNGSGVVGDSNVNVVTTEVTVSPPPAAVLAAIPVSEGQVTEGEILGEAQAATEGGVLGEEATPSAEISPSPAPALPGGIFSNRNLWIVALIILVLGGGYYFYQRSRQ